MPYSARNLFYLRVSSQMVIPLYVSPSQVQTRNYQNLKTFHRQKFKIYLDERHFDWMSDRIQQRVVSDLRTLILPKLKAESDAHLGPGGPPNAKRGTVDVHRGDFYQFAYFLRKAESHSVLIKTREFVMRPQVQLETPAQPTEHDEAPSSTKRGSKKRKKSATDSPNPLASKKTKKSGRKSKMKDSRTQDPEAQEEIIEETPSESEDVLEQESNSPTLRRSTRDRKASLFKEVSENESDDGSDFEMEDAPLSEDDGDEQLEIKLEEEDTSIVDNELEAEKRPKVQVRSAFDLEDEEEEEKKLKPALQLRYQGFSIYDRCLCVVIEPWPALPPRARTRDPSIAPGSVEMFRAPSITPSEVGDEATFEREKNTRPLFLPDVYRNRSVTPAPGLSAFRAPSVFSSMNAHMDTSSINPDFEALQTIDDDDEQFGMMAFSQALNSVSGETGGEQDGDDIDSSAMFADADEARDFS